MRSAARPVEKGDLADMFLDDLLDDRETEAGAAHPRGHIGFGQPLAVLGKADAGVQHIEDEIAVFFVQTQLDAIAGKAVFAAILPSFNGFYAVLHDIGERLTELPAITHHAEFAFWRVEDERDPGMGDLMQEQGLARDLVDVLVAEHRLGHARKVREFVDHTP